MWHRDGKTHQNAASMTSGTAPARSAWGVGSGWCGRGGRSGRRAQPGAAGRGKQSQRVRKYNHAVNFHAVAGARSPHRAREIAKPVGGKQSGALEWRNEEATCQMRLMVFDTVKLCANFLWIGIKRRRQRFRNPREFRQHFDAFPRERWHAQRIK